MPFVKEDDDDTPPMDAASSSTVPEPEGPGRDSARLLQDIIEHRYRDEALYTAPPLFDPTKPHRVQVASHSHSWVMKTRQSVQGRPWNAHFEDQSVFAVCETCRLHILAQGIITTEGVPKCGSGSEGSNFSSHHFHPESWTAPKRTQDLGGMTAFDWNPEFVSFICCQCPFQLSTEFWNPVVPEHLLSTLKRRKMEYSSTASSSASSSSLDRAADPKAFAARAFRTLSTYCTHVLDGSASGGTPRTINYRPDSPFAKRVGLNSDVIAFVNSLGWQQHQDIESFQPPTWDENLEQGRIRRKRLEAAEIELAVLARQNAKDCDTAILANFQPDIMRAERDMAKLMAAEPWPRQTSLSAQTRQFFQKEILLDAPVNPSFAALGIVTESEEAMVLEAYKKQIKDDPNHTIFYLECLQDIGSQMQSKRINQFAEGESLKGNHTGFDLARAYQVLEIDQPEIANDDAIIALYQSRCFDYPDRTGEFHKALLIIQVYRQSPTIATFINPAEDKKEMDVHDAYRRLRIDDQYAADDSIIANFVSYTHDYPEEKNTLTEALQVIGKFRNSLSIKSFLSEQNESQVAVGPYERAMPLNEAFVVLGITDDAGVTDDVIIFSYHQLAVAQPTRLEEFKKAVEVIADHRDSISLKTFLIDLNTTPEKQQAGPGSENHPVGLENVAQTCYMNSLFQYYFTVKPLRNAILNFEQHEEGDLSDEDLKKKQISRWELQRSKRFIAQLRLLFQDLITSELAYIRPKEELVRLTLTDVKRESEEEEIKRRQSLNTDVSTSILDSELPGLIDIEDNSVPKAPVSSPQLNPQDVLSPTREAASEMAKISISNIHDEPEYEIVDHESNDSGVVMSDPMSDASVIDKENAGNGPVAKARLGKSPLGESQQINVVAAELEDVEMTDIDREPLTPPKTPPPVPKRPRRKSTWGALKYGSQQDVTECITNCLSQLHAGFKPEGFDSNGQPIDLFKQLFYIRVKHVFRAMQADPSAKPIEEKEELFGSMVPVYVDSETGSSLYDAIDLALGREQIEYKGIGEAEKSTTITSLPPILQIQIVRTQFNRSVGAGYKENAHLELESKIFMDRYMEVQGDQELSSRRDDYWKWKVNLNRAQRKKAELLRKDALPFNPLEMLSMARGYLQEFSNTLSSVPAELLDGLAVYESDLRKQVERLDKDISTLKSRIKQQFTDRRKYGYRLHSVFIHRGDILHGHYWIYIYDFAHNRWFKYNDEQVTEVDEKIVYADTSAEGAGPYFVTYIREDIAENLVEVVKRDLSGNLKSFVD